MELLRMINGRSLPTKAIRAELARELDSDLPYLEKLAEEIRNDLSVQVSDPQKREESPDPSLRSMVTAPQE
jgi:hypothetical protein